MAEPTVQELQQQLTDLNKKLREAGGLGIDLQEAFRNAGNDTKKLNEYVDRLNKQYEDIVDNADYIYRTFQDITAELKNQNVLLKIGKGAFKEFTNIAQDLNSYQKGYNDLTDNKFKKLKNNLAAEKKELDFVVQRLKASEASRQREVEALNALDERTPKQKARLQELLKENELLINATEAISSGIPILEKELNLTKQIADTRKDLGGLAQAAGKLVSQYGGSLASFLNVGEATEAVEDFNKKLIQDALSTEKVKNDLLENERKKRLAEIGKDEAGNSITQEQAQERLIALEKESYKIKQEAVASTDNLGNKFKSLGVFVKGLGVGLKKSLTDPVTILTFIIDKALQANEQAVNLGKIIGYGADRSDRLRENFAFIAGVTPNINVNSKSITEAFGELAQSTGYVSQYSADQLETQVKLTKQVGLQADEAAQIQRFAVLNGKTSEETYSSFVRGLTAARNQLKVGINFKSALAEASKVSGQLAANLGNNPEQIAKAVVAAKAFGMTLEQVAAAGDKLLDFGSSIENELKAELLTGKQINLERARAAALAGDQVTLAEELSKNIGTAAEFTKMNRLQQNALAESVGMTSDQLAETLRKREEALASGKSLVQIQEEEAKQALERQQIQEKFSAALLKIQDVVGNLVAGPFGQLFDLVSNIASIFTNIISPVITGISYVVGLIVEGFKTLSPILLGIGGLIAAMNAKLLINAVLSVAQGAWKALGGIFPVGPILATAATLAGVGLVTRLAKGTAFAEGGIVTGEINNATVGEAGPEAIIPLNSPQADKILGGDGSPSIDLTPMIAAINEVRAAVDRLYSKDTSINMDGKKVGSTLVQGSYKVA